METQPHEHQQKLTPVQILQRMRQKERESDKQEMYWLQTQMTSMQRRMKWLYSKMQSESRNTGEISPMPAVQGEAITTPPAFQPPIKVSSNEWQQVSASLERHQSKLVDSGPPTTQLNNPDVALMATVLLPLDQASPDTNTDIIPPDTGNTDIRPVRLLLQTSQPQETIYTSDEPLVLLLEHGVRLHETNCQRATDIIQMPQPVYALLAKIEMNEYITAERHIPFLINDDLPSTTITHTIKCISYS